MGTTKMKMMERRRDSREKERKRERGAVEICSLARPKGRFTVYSRIQYSTNNNTNK